MWNKDDHARQILINHKDTTSVSANDKKPNVNPVSET